METITKTLQSGKELKITIAPFDEANELWIAINKELRTIRLSEDVEIDSNLIKEVFCTAASSRDILKAMKPLLNRCIYDGEKITVNTFDSREAREDYLEIFEMVATENVAPFVKSLVQKYKGIILAVISKGQSTGQAEQPT